MVPKLGTRPLGYREKYQEDREGYQGIVMGVRGAREFSIACLTLIRFINMYHC